jgi:hypothetical protein
MVGNRLVVNSPYGGSKPFDWSAPTPPTQEELAQIAEEQGLNVAPPPQIAPEIPSLPDFLSPSAPSAANPPSESPTPPQLPVQSPDIGNAYNDVLKAAPGPGIPQAPNLPEIPNIQPQAPKISKGVLDRDLTPQVTSSIEYGNVVEPGQPKSLEELQALHPGDPKYWAQGQAAPPSPASLGSVDYLTGYRNQPQTYGDIPVAPPSDANLSTQQLLQQEGQRVSGGLDKTIEAARTPIVKFQDLPIVPTLNAGEGQMFQSLNQLRGSNPNDIPTAIANKLAEVGSSFTTPENAAIIATMGVATPLVAGIAEGKFTYDMLAGAIHTLPQIKEAADKGDWATVASGVTELATLGYFGTKTGKGALEVGRNALEGARLAGPGKRLEGAVEGTKYGAQTAELERETEALNRENLGVKSQPVSERIGQALNLPPGTGSAILGRGGRRESLTKRAEIGSSNPEESLKKLGELQVGSPETSKPEYTVGPPKEMHPLQIQNRKALVDKAVEYIKSNYGPEALEEVFNRDPNELWRAVEKVPGLSKQKYYKLSENSKQMIMDELTKSPEAGPVRTPEVTEAPRTMEVVEASKTQKQPWEMTREELSQAHEEAKGADKRLLTELFGDNAQTYERAARAAESSNSERANAAQQVVDHMEESLTEAQRNKLYGIGETGATIEDLGDYRSALNQIDVSSPEALGDSLKYAMTKIGTERDPANMDHNQRVAYAQIQEAFRVAKEQDWSTKEISDAALKGAAGRFSDPNDAAYMLEQFRTKSEKAPKAIEGPEANLTNKLREFMKEESGTLNVTELINKFKETRGSVRKNFRLLDRALEKTPFAPVVDMMKKAYFDKHAWSIDKYQKFDAASKGFKDWKGLHDYLEGVRTNPSPEVTRVGDAWLKLAENMHGASLGPRAKFSDYITELMNKNRFSDQTKDDVAKAIASDPKQMMREYVNMTSDVVNERPQTKQAQQFIDSQAPGIDKEMAQMMVDNMTGADLARSASRRGIKEFDDIFARSGSRSVLAFSTKLQALHMGRFLTQGVPELITTPGKSAKGIVKALASPKEAINRARDAGLLQQQSVPWRFKNKGEKFDALANFMDAGNTFSKVLIHEAMRERFRNSGGDWERKAVEETAKAEGMVTPYSKSNYIGRAPKSLVRFKDWFQQYVENVGQAGHDAVIKRDPKSALKFATYIGTAVLAEEIAKKTGIKFSHIHGYNAFRVGSPELQAAANITEALTHVKNNKLSPQLVRAIAEFGRIAIPGAGLLTKEVTKHGEKSLKVRNPLDVFNPLVDQKLRGTQGSLGF